MPIGTRCSDGCIDVENQGHIGRVSFALLKCFGFQEIVANSGGWLRWTVAVRCGSQGFEAVVRFNALVNGSRLQGLPYSFVFWKE